MDKEIKISEKLKIPRGSTIVHTVDTKDVKGKPIKAGELGIIQPRYLNEKIRHPSEVKVLHVWDRGDKFNRTSIHAEADVEHEMRLATPEDIQAHIDEKMNHLKTPKYKDAARGLYGLRLYVVGILWAAQQFIEHCEGAKDFQFRDVNSYMDLGSTQNRYGLSVTSELYIKYGLDEAEKILDFCHNLLLNHGAKFYQSMMPEFERLAKEFGTRTPAEMTESEMTTTRLNTEQNIVTFLKEASALLGTPGILEVKEVSSLMVDKAMPEVFRISVKMAVENKLVNNRRLKSMALL